MAVNIMLPNIHSHYKNSKYRDTVNFDNEIDKGLLIHVYDYVTDPQDGSFQYVHFTLYGKIIGKSKMGMSDGVNFEIFYSNSPHWRRKTMFLQYLSIIDDGAEFVKFFTNKYYPPPQETSYII